MKNPAPLHCDLHGTIEELPAFFERLEVWADTADLPVGLMARFGLMLDELLTNVAMHAYLGQGGPVSVQVDFLPPDGVQAVIRDLAPAFDPTGRIAPDLDLALEDREIGGLGLHFVRRLANRFSYRRDDNCNEVIVGLVAGE